MEIESCLIDFMGPESKPILWKRIKNYLMMG